MKTSIIKANIKATKLFSSIRDVGRAEKTRKPNSPVLRKLRAFEIVILNFPSEQETETTLVFLAIGK